MMDTVLNLGLNDEVVEGLAAKRGERFAFDCYRRLLDMFGDVVLGIEHAQFEAEMHAVKVGGRHWGHPAWLLRLEKRRLPASNVACSLAWVQPAVTSLLGCVPGSAPAMPGAHQHEDGRLLASLFARAPSSSSPLRRRPVA